MSTQRCWAVILAALLGVGACRLSWAQDAAPGDDLKDVPDLGVPQREHDVALVIGVEKYLNDLPNADYAENDARAVRDYLVALGYPPRNIEYRVNSLATRALISKSLRDIGNRVKPDSRVFVYYSGHGAPDPVSGEAYLVPADGDPSDLGETAYPLKKLYDQLGKLRAAEVVVVLDSCFSGRGPRSVLAKGAKPLVTMVSAPAPLAPKMAVLTSTQGDQISTSYPEKGHGLFTYYFLKSIQEGKSGLSSIYEEVKPKVQDQAKSLNGQEQAPTLLPGPEKARGMFAFVMHVKPKEKGPDPAQMKKLQEMQASIEEQKRQLQEIQQKLQERQSQVDQEAQAKEEKRQRDLEQQQQELQKQQEDLQRQRQDLEQQRTTNENEAPTFVPPTF